MQLAKVKLPLNKAGEFAAFSFENSVRVILSYTQEEFFGGSLIAHIAIEDEKVKQFQDSSWGKLLIN